jgi:glucose dehydrogenase
MTPAACSVRRPSTLCALAALSAMWLAARAAPAQAPAASDWGYYGGDAFGQRFSSLDQINRGNVARLTVAWSYHTG